MASEFLTIESKDGGSFRAYLTFPPRGFGPGIVLCHEMFGANATMREMADIYAEEGYVVAVPDLFWREEAGVELDYTSGDWQRAYQLSQSYDFDLGVEDIDATLKALQSRSEVRSATTASMAINRANSRNGSEPVPATAAQTANQSEGFAGPSQRETPGGLSVVGFSMGGKLACLAACKLEHVSCGVSYYGPGIADELAAADGLRGRLVIHLPENDKFTQKTDRDKIVQRFKGSRHVEVYQYPRVASGFARRDTEPFDRPAATIAHQRTMGALKREMGPYFDLSSIWDAHVRHTIEDGDIDALMNGMVDEPSVNNVPTRTGGVGGEKVRAFYANHFIGQMPADTRLVPLSRTVGATQLIEETVLSLTHSTVIDWLLPGVAPSQRYVEIPLVCVATFRGEKIHRIQTYWDQASLLVQIGKIDAASLPVAGIECARKIVNEDLPSNELIERAQP